MRKRLPRAGSVPIVSFLDRQGQSNAAVRMLHLRQAGDRRNQSFRSSLPISEMRAKAAIGTKEFPRGPVNLWFWHRQDLNGARVSILDDIEIRHLVCLFEVDLRHRWRRCAEGNLTPAAGRHA